MASVLALAELMVRRTGHMRQRSDEGAEDMPQKSLKRAHRWHDQSSERPWRGIHLRQVALLLFAAVTDEPVERLGAKPYVTIN